MWYSFISNESLIIGRSEYFKWITYYRMEIIEWREYHFSISFMHIILIRIGIRCWCENWITIRIFSYLYWFPTNLLTNNCQMINCYAKSFVILKLDFWHGYALFITQSQVFLMDPWWNPAVERQAQDRIHRIGQYKPIRYCFLHTLKLKTVEKC